MFESRRRHHHAGPWPLETCIASAAGDEPTTFDKSQGYQGDLNSLSFPGEAACRPREGLVSEDGVLGLAVDANEIDRKERAVIAGDGGASGPDGGPMTL